MKYLLYKITNLVNGKIYVGVHKTKNINDGYMGSGFLIKKAILKYKIENFKKEVIAECTTEEEMFELEKLIVTQEFVSSNKTYNLKIGGIGGFDHINENISFEEKSIICLKGWNSRTKESQLLQLSKMSLGLHKKIEKDGGPFTGNIHTLEAKEKIGKNSSICQKGLGNSQSGTAWMYNLKQKINIKIKKEKISIYENLGWVKGRKMKF
jgi:hypothetical protein